MSTAFSAAPLDITGEKGRKGKEWGGGKQKNKNQGAVHSHMTQEKQ